MEGEPARAPGSVASGCAGNRSVRVARLPRRMNQPGGWPRLETGWRLMAVGFDFSALRAGRMNRAGPRPRLETVWASMDAESRDLRPLPWKMKPSWFLVAEEDRMISPETQRFMADRMNATIRSHKVDHSPMLTSPDLVVEVILEAAHETIGR